MCIVMFLKLCAASLVLWFGTVQGAEPVVRRSANVGPTGQVKVRRKPIVRKVHAKNKMSRLQNTSITEPVLTNRVMSATHVLELDQSTKDEFTQEVRPGKYIAPAGCFQPKNPNTAKHFSGIYPIEEFEYMLATRKGKLWRNGSIDYALSKKLAVPFCPEPLPESSVAETSDEATLIKFVGEALEGTDANKPIILALGELSVSHNYHLLQVMNFICGFQRLGLENQVVFFTMSNKSAVLLRRLYPWLRVLYHDGLTKLIGTASERVNIRGNRVAKLVVSELLVSMHKEVLLTDLDTHWTQDPIEYIQTLKTPAGALVDMAAMRDSCWLELNSGFVYYRPTARTQNLLRMALNTEKFAIVHPSVPNLSARLLADNDQYLLNCALARSAIAGLSYVILPREEFTFGTINHHCRDQQRGNTALVAPMVWHTAGFSSSYELEMDRFAALGFIDVNASTGQCLTGRRGSVEDIRKASLAVSRLCSTSPDGIVTAACVGQCTDNVEPTHAQRWLAKFGQAPLE